MDTLRYWAALNMVQGLESLKVKALIDAFGSARAVLQAPASELRGAARLSPAVARRITDWESAIDPDGELERAYAAGLSILCIEDEQYPRYLREVHDPPIVLYVRGTLAPQDDRAVAIVGTRRPSYYGTSTTERLAGDLARRGLTVVSGLARGIDSAAHRGALAAGGRTIAVLGCGADVVYPPENGHLMKEVAASGAVITEFPMGFKPERRNFPRRNRIISGMSFGTVVVEAAARSGSLITARLALEEGREVFAVPGKVDSPVSSGTNSLIKQGARLIETADDVLEELRPMLGELPAAPQSAARPADTSERPAGLSDGETELLGLLSSDPVHIDALIRRSGKPAGEISATLMMLEVKRLARQLPGKLFVRR